MKTIISKAVFLAFLLFAAIACPLSSYALTPPDCSLGELTVATSGNCKVTGDVLKKGKEQLCANSSATPTMECQKVSEDCRTAFGDWVIKNCPWNSSYVAFVCNGIEFNRMATNQRDGQGDLSGVRDDQAFQEACHLGDGDVDTNFGEECDLGAQNGKPGSTCTAEGKIVLNTSPTTTTDSNNSGGFATQIDPPAQNTNSAGCALVGASPGSSMGFALIYGLGLLPFVAVRRKDK